MAGVRNFDAKKVAMTFAGVPISGLADGTFLSAEHNEEIFALQVGADGEATRSRNNNNSGRVTFTLLSSSSSNAALSALYNLDANSPGAGGTGPLLVKDLSGNTLVVAEVAWIVKLPTVEMGREATEREWVMETNNLQMFVGANTSIGGTIDAADAIDLDNL